jgi:hypothetical protein
MPIKCGRATQNHQKTKGKWGGKERNGYVGLELMVAKHSDVLVCEGKARGRGEMGSGFRSVRVSLLCLCLADRFAILAYRKSPPHCSAPFLSMGEE